MDYRNTTTAGIERAKTQLLIIIITLVGWLMAAQPAPATKATSPAKPAEVVAPWEIIIAESTFVYKTNEPGFGRDPFYPKYFNSLRQPSKTPTGTPGFEPKTNAVSISSLPPNIVPPGEIPVMLTGLLGTRVAIINDQNFLKGDEGYVQVPDGRMRIRVDEIKSRSVSVTIFVSGKEPVKKELPLREQ